MECKECRGAGIRWNGEACKHCGGSGKTSAPATKKISYPESETFFKVLSKTRRKYRCEPCRGYGLCPSCNGERTRNVRSRVGHPSTPVDCEACLGVTVDQTSFSQGNSNIHGLLEQGVDRLDGGLTIGRITVGPTSRVRAKGLEFPLGEPPTGLCRGCRGTGSRDPKAEERELNALGAQWDEEVLPELRQRYFEESVKPVLKIGSEDLLDKARTLLEEGNQFLRETQSAPRSSKKE